MSARRRRPAYLLSFYAGYSDPDLASFLYFLMFNFYSKPRTNLLFCKNKRLGKIFWTPAECRRQLQPCCVRHRREAGEDLVTCCSRKYRTGGECSARERDARKYLCLRINVFYRYAVLMNVGSLVKVTSRYVFHYCVSVVDVLLLWHTSILDVVQSRKHFPDWIT